MDAADEKSVLVAWVEPRPLIMTLPTSSRYATGNMWVAAELTRLRGREEGGEKSDYLPRVPRLHSVVAVLGGGKPGLRVRLRLDHTLTRLWLGYFDSKEITKKVTAEWRWPQVLLVPGERMDAELGE
ncbi:hypothetical protein MTO96_041766 [Rhipicephalus appendiculatus]